MVRFPFFLVHFSSLNGFRVFTRAVKSENKNET